MQQVFKNALYHTEPTVLLRRLLPLSLGHLYQLYAAESAYAIKGGKPGLPDLVYAVGICSRTFEQGMAWLRRPRLLAECERWGRRARNRVDPEEEHQVFLEYVDQFAIFPERYQDDKLQAKPCKHPWPLVIAVKIIPLVGESRAWNMPLPLALSYWSALAETEGDESLRGEDDERRRALQLAHMAEQAKKAEHQ